MANSSSSAAPSRPALKRSRSERAFLLLLRHAGRGAPATDADAVAYEKAYAQGHRHGRPALRTAWGAGRRAHGVFRSSSRPLCPPFTRRCRKRGSGPSSIHALKRADPDRRRPRQSISPSTPRKPNRLAPLAEAAGTGWPAEAGTGASGPGPWAWRCRPYQKRGPGGDRRPSPTWRRARAAGG